MVQTFPVPLPMRVGGFSMQPLPNSSFSLLDPFCSVGHKVLRRSHLKIIKHTVSTIQKEKRNTKTIFRVNVAYRHNGKTNYNTWCRETIPTKVVSLKPSMILASCNKIIIILFCYTLQNLHTPLK